MRYFPFHPLMFQSWTGGGGLLVPFEDSFSFERFKLPYVERVEGVAFEILYES